MATIDLMRPFKGGQLVVETSVVGLDNATGIDAADLAAASAAVLTVSGGGGALPLQRRSDGIGGSLS